MLWKLIAIETFSDDIMDTETGKKKPTQIFRYVVKNDQGGVVNSDRWMTPDRVDSIKREFDVLKKYTGKVIDLTEDGIVNALCLTQAELGNVPVNVTSKDNVYYMSLIITAQTEDEKRAAAKAALARMNISSGSGGNSGRGRRAE